MHGCTRVLAQHFGADAVNLAGLQDGAGAMSGRQGTPDSGRGDDGASFRPASTASAAEDRVDVRTRIESQHHPHGANGNGGQRPHQPVVATAQDRALRRALAVADDVDAFKLNVVLMHALPKHAQGHQ
ncbi:Uncharacterised protein [Mycobacteroides abscessus subsp. abscessus]|nr:Uncharacterised protein [Mycobacteroides abscessus subsp. abscessus]SLC84286.1 Uncharacterised protein [Mycobacteroides abscessus subsp. massiliense]